MTESFDDFIDKLANEHNQKLEGVSREQFEDCLLGAIKSGDFQSVTTPMETRVQPGMTSTTMIAEQRVGMSYMPYRRVSELESKITELTERIDFHESLIKWQHETYLAIQAGDREYLKKNLFRFKWKDVL